MGVPLPLPTIVVLAVGASLIPATVLKAAAAGLSIFALFTTSQRC